jgi:hypothetical protein
MLSLYKQGPYLRVLSNPPQHCEAILVSRVSWNVFRRLCESFLSGTRAAATLSPLGAAALQVLTRLRVRCRYFRCLQLGVLPTRLFQTPSVPVHLAPTNQTPKPDCLRSETQRPVSRAAARGAGGWLRAV